jgi:hypothetical protein
LPDGTRPRVWAAQGAEIDKKLRVERKELEELTVERVTDWYCWERGIKRKKTRGGWPRKREPQ